VDTVFTNASTEGEKGSTDVQTATSTEEQKEPDDTPMRDSSAIGSSQSTAETGNTKVANV
jgi:hypothetical protein